MYGRVCVPALDIAVSLSPGTAETLPPPTPKPHLLTLHPLQLPGVLAVFGSVCAAIAADRPFFLHTLVYFIST